MVGIVMAAEQPIHDWNRFMKRQIVHARRIFNLGDDADLRAFGMQNGGNRLAHGVPHHFQAVQPL